MILSITKLTFNALNPIKRFTLDKKTVLRHNICNLFFEYFIFKLLKISISPARNADFFWKWGRTHCRPSPHPFRARVLGSQGRLYPANVMTEQQKYSRYVAS